MARPTPEPTALQALKGNSSSRVNGKDWKEDGREEPTPAVAGTEVPEELLGDAYAVQEWERLAPELVRLGMLTRADTKVLMMYCVAYSQWRQLREGWTPSSVTVESRTGSQTMSAESKMMMELYRQLLAYSDRLGLNPSARTRIRVKAPEWSQDPQPKNDYFTH